MTERLRVRLDADQKAELARRASLEDLSESELLRRIIAERAGGKRR